MTRMEECQGGTKAGFFARCPSRWERKWRGSGVSVLEWVTEESVSALDDGMSEQLKDSR